MHALYTIWNFYKIKSTEYKRFPYEIVSTSTATDNYSNINKQILFILSIMHFNRALFFPPYYDKVKSKSVKGATSTYIAGKKINKIKIENRIEEWRKKSGLLRQHSFFISVLTFPFFLLLLNFAFIIFFTAIFAVKIYTFCMKIYCSIYTLIYPCAVTVFAFTIN